MLTLAPYLIVALTAVVMFGRLFHQMYDTPRNLFLSYCGLGVLTWWVLGASVIYLPPTVVYILGAMLVWWTLSTVYSPHTKTALRGLVILSAPIIALMLLPVVVADTGIIILLAAGLINAGYAFMQSVLKIEPMKWSANRRTFSPIGLIGNGNMLGIYLVPLVFLAAYLGFNQHWGWFGFGLGLAGIIMVSRCRGAMLGVLGGIVFLALIDYGTKHQLAALQYSIIGIVLVWLLKPSLFHNATLIERTRFWIIALYAILKRPLLGNGGDCLGPDVPFIQRTLNEKTTGRFLDPAKYQFPWPRACHNDYLQHASSFGIVGLGLYLFIIIYALMSPADTVLKAAYIGLLISGLFFHTTNIKPIGVTFWLLTSLLLQSYGEKIAIGIPLWLGLTLIGLYVVLIHRVVIKAAVSDHYVAKAGRTEQQEYLMKALEYDDTNTTAHAFSGIMEIKQGHMWSAMWHTIAILDNYSGVQRIWEQWCNLGETFVMMGALDVAEKCYKESLAFWPEHQLAKNGLAKVNKIRGMSQQLKIKKLEVVQNERTRCDMQTDSRREGSRSRHVG